MGLFRRNPPGFLPPSILMMMERFGRHEIDPQNSQDDGYEVWKATQEPLFPLATGDPQRFLRELADVCVPAGGWPVYGADRTVINLLSERTDDEAWLRILDGSIAFLRANFVPPIRVPRYAWERFIDCGGTNNTWIALRQPPSPEEASITPLAVGEIRRVLKVAAEADANVILVARDGDAFVALIDARYSFDDPTRSQSEWMRAGDLYALYCEVAWSAQVWDWVDPELARFMPTPRALI